MPRSDAVCLADPGLVVWALTAPEHGTSDTCGLIAWTSNIMWEGRLLQRPKQLKIINHKVRKTMHSTALSECASLPPSLSETSCFPLMTSWRARCIQFFCWMNNVIFHWLITINIYVKNSGAVFRVKCEEWQVGCHRLYFLLADYTGVIFTLTSHNVTWFYYCNCDFIHKIWH